MICPIRPFNQHNCDCGTACPLVDDAEGWSSIAEAPINAESAELVDDEPADVVEAEGEDVIQPGQPLPEPRLPSPAEIARR